MHCRVKPLTLDPAQLHAIDCTCMRARWPECLVFFVHMFRCAYTHMHTRRHARTHARTEMRTHTCARASMRTHARNTRCPLCSNAHQQNVSVRPSHAPAVPKAVQMLELTADQYIPSGYISKISEWLYLQIPAK